MGGAAADGSVEWKETWWEKADRTGLKELGAEKSGFTAAGDTWWETWRETYRQDEWSGIAQIERSASKWARGPQVISIFPVCATKVGHRRPPI